MELYILDDLFNRVEVIDRFESLIWTERFSAYGDFELVIISTRDARKKFQTGTRFALNESYRVMVAEEIEDKIDSEGRRLITIKGRSLEAILEDRVARNTFADLSNAPKWILTGTPGAVVRRIFDEICRNNVNFADDQIPYLQPGSLYPASTIPEPTEEITVELSLMTVYAAIKEICEAYKLGFRLVFDPMSPEDVTRLYFDFYSGSDRTISQDVLPAVVFSPELDNLTDVAELTSITKYKNVAYVYHTIGVQVVMADEVSSEIDGFDRRVLHVDATSIEVPERTYTVTAAQESAINAARDLSTNTDAQKAAMDALLQKKRLTTEQVTLANAIGAGVLTSAQRTQIQQAVTVSVNYNQIENDYINPLLQQKGREELAKNRSVLAFDGEIPPNSPYKYNIDYNLGDLVEMRSSDGITNQMRVAEQIFVSDSEGDRSYPTLTLDRLISAGSWLAWNYNEAWIDAEGEWAEV